MNAQEVIDRARLPLNDAGKVRYSDADGLSYLKEVIRMLRRMRPDAFIGSLASDPAASIVLTPTPSDVPGGYEYYQVLADYVSARWQDKDDELTGEKAAGWLSLAIGGAV